MGSESKGETCLSRSPYPPTVRHVIVAGKVEHIILNGQCMLDKPHDEHLNYLGERWYDVYALPEERT